MANPCALLQKEVDELDQRITALLDFLWELPPRQRAIALAEAAKLRRQLRRLQKQLDSCELDPGPYLLQGDGIEVTQSIQDLQHSVPLVAGKITAVRVYLSYYATPGITVRGELVARSRTGTLATFSSANEVALTDATAGQIGPKRLDINASLNFFLPPGFLIPGDWTFSLNNVTNTATSAVVVPARGVSVSVRVIAGTPLRVRILGVRYTTGTPATTFTPSQRDFDLLISWLGRAYPVSTVLATVGLIDIAPSTPIPFQSGDVNQQLAAIRAMDVSVGMDRRTHYYGMVSDGAFFMRGAAAGIPGGAPDPSTVACGPAGPANWGWDFDGSYGDWYGGHELGHTFGRFHPGFCGQDASDPSFPFPNGQLAANPDSFVGFDVGDAALGIPAAVYPGTEWHDVMTYCERQWLCSYTYEGIRQRLIAEDAMAGGPVPMTTNGNSGGPPDRRYPNTVRNIVAAAAVAGVGSSLISIIARVNLTKQEGRIEHVNPVAAGDISQPDASSGVKLVLRKADSTVAAEFEPAVKLDSCLAANDERTGMVDVIVQVPTDLAQIELVVMQRSAHTFRAVSAAPSILRTARISAHPSQPSEQGLSWETVGAPEDDGIRYAVQASTDDGNVWHTIAVGLRQAGFQLDPTQFPGAKRVTIRVLASNGFTQTISESHVFEL